MAIRQDQADYAAQLIQHSATLTMAVAVKDAIEAVVPALPGAVRRDGNHILQAVDAIVNNTSKPWNVAEDQVATAYHLSRLIRNAYAHAPFAPKWKINRHIRDTAFTIPNVIELHTRGLDGNGFDWRPDYGGPLALYQLCRFTRFDILGDERRIRTNIPQCQRTLFQLGNLVLEHIDEVPEGYVPVSVEPNADGSIDLGHGYRIQPARGEKLRQTCRPCCCVMPGKGRELPEDLAANHDHYALSRLRARDS